MRDPTNYRELSTSGFFLFWKTGWNEKRSYCDDERDTLEASDNDEPRFGADCFDFAPRCFAIDFCAVGFPVERKGKIETPAGLSQYRSRAFSKYSRVCDEDS